MKMLLEEAKTARERRTWIYPYDIYAQIFKIVDFGNDALEITPAGARSILERGRVDLCMMLVSYIIDLHDEWVMFHLT